MPELISSYVPQRGAGRERGGEGRGALTAWALLAGGVLLLVGLVVVAPLARAHGWPLVSFTAYKAFGVACHQMPERSFHVEGFPLAVCARCAGLYAGFAVGVLLYPLLRARALAGAGAPARAWLLLAALPTVVDFALGSSGVWENTHLTRFVTACVLGWAAAFYVVPGFVEVWQAVRRQTFWRRGWPGGAKLDAGV